jgi:sterol desaturase/sphingolipid hydroxylase (fatty acid hydroxylase superfamily)
MLPIFTAFTEFIKTLFPWRELLSEEIIAVLLILVFAFLSSWEWRSPKIEHARKNRARSYHTNLGMFVFNNFMISILSISSLLALIEHSPGKGLLEFIDSPVAKVVLSFLLLDLFHYLWHKTCHSFDGLWMFHRVHHNDSYLNVSTAFRIHLVEMILTTLLKAVYIVLLDIDKKIVLAYETAYPFFVMFHHANISFRGERLLGHLLITPYLHRAHHSRERKEHDSNYGAILSVWDSLLLTKKEVEPAAVGIYGESPQTLPELIKFGFKSPAPAAPVPVTPMGSGKGFTVDMHAMIAEAAYYKAEKRSFSPGYELYDWLEAKREIFRQVYGDRCANC